MSYRVNQDQLAPMLARCLVVHGSMEAIAKYVDEYHRSGRGDATVTAEFICTHEISLRPDRQEIIDRAEGMAANAREAAMAQLEVPEAVMPRAVPEAPPVAAPAIEPRRRRPGRLVRFLVASVCSFIVAFCVQLRVLDTKAMRVPFPEGAIYLVPGSVIYTIVSPTFLQVLAYPEAFYQKARWASGNAVEPDGLCRVEGGAWAIAQGVAFYGAFFFLFPQREPRSRKE